MKIFVNARFLTQPLSGVQRYGIECSRQIKKSYPEASFISPPNILHDDIANELGVIVTGKKTGHIWEQTELPMFMAKQKQAPLLNLANTAPLLYSNNYVTIHDLAFYHHPEWNSRKFSTWYNILIPRLALRSKHVFTVSETVKRELIKCYGLPPSKISVTYNGISQAMLNHPPEYKKAKEKIILAVGTFNKRKNHQNLVSAFQASELKDEYQLVIIGDKNKIFTESGFDELHLVRHNIKVYPTLTEEELIAMYQQAEIVVSLSLYEGFGIPLLEGLYNGCKIVCSDIPVYKELYDGVAHFCNPANIENIAATLIKSIKTAHPEANDNSKLFDKFNYQRAAEVILEKVLNKKA
jgi:glycosyltransferase involved in cell wall biosynthesis